MRHGSVREDVREFVVARSDRLLRSAYLLTGDPDRAETLLQTALAQAWLSWDRSELDPDSSVRAAMVRWHVSRPAARSDPGSDLWRALRRLPRRQLAVVVLRYAEGLSGAEAAEALGCSAATVSRLESRALATLPTVSFSDLPAALSRLGEGVVDARPADRLAQVEHRTETRRTLHRAGAVAQLALLLVVGLVVRAVLTQPVPATPRLIPGEARTRPLLAGHRLPAVVRVHGREFRSARSEESPAGHGVLTLVLTSSSRAPQAIAWASPVGAQGRIVVSLDGDVVRRTRAGRLDSGLLLSGRRSHVVGLRATRPSPTMRLGVAVYR